VAAAGRQRGGNCRRGDDLSAFGHTQRLNWPCRAHRIPNQSSNQIRRNDRRAIEKLAGQNNLT
jgi:hypothetical protein